MNLWKCAVPTCMTTAAGRGNPVGLTALGWSWDSSTLLCPGHHPDQESSIADTAVIQYVLENNYDTFTALDAERRLRVETPVTSLPPSLPAAWPPSAFPGPPPVPALTFPFPGKLFPGK